MYLTQFAQEFRFDLNQLQFQRSFIEELRRTHEALCQLTYGRTSNLTNLLN